MGCGFGDSCADCSLGGVFDCDGCDSDDYRDYDPYDYEDDWVDYDEHPREVQPGQVQGAPSGVQGGVPDHIEPASPESVIQANAPVEATTSSAPDASASESKAPSLFERMMAQAAENEAKSLKSKLYTPEELDPFHIETEEELDEREEREAKEAALARARTLAEINARPWPNMVAEEVTGSTIPSMTENDLETWEVPSNTVIEPAEGGRYVDRNDPYDYEDDCDGYDECPHENDAGEDPDENTSRRINHCSACGTSINSRWNYCIYCGTAREQNHFIQKYCTQCGKAVLHDWGFCPNCGSRIPVLEYTVQPFVESTDYIEGIPF